MDRIEKLMQSIPSDLDSVLITSSVNRRYYTKLPSSAGILLITREQAYFLIDFRYIEVARNTIKNCKVLLQEGDGRNQLREIVAKHGLKKIGIESGFFIRLAPSVLFPGGRPSLCYAVENILRIGGQ